MLALKIYFKNSIPGPNTERQADPNYAIGAISSIVLLIISIVITKKQAKHGIWLIIYEYIFVLSF